MSQLPARLVISTTMHTPKADRSDRLQQACFARDLYRKYANPVNLKDERSRSDQAATVRLGTTTHEATIEDGQARGQASRRSHATTWPGAFP